MVRNFPKALSKDCLSLKDLGSPKICRSWLDAVGQGGLSLTGGIPVYQDFYSSYIRIAQSVPVGKTRQNSKRRHNTPDAELTGGIAWLSKNMERKYSVIDPRTRHSFYLAFGVTPCQQLALESFYRKVEWRFLVERFGVLQHLPKWC